LEDDLADEAILMKTCDAAVKARYHMIVDQCHSRVPPIFIPGQTHLKTRNGFQPQKVEKRRKDL